MMARTYSAQSAAAAQCTLAVALCFPASPVCAQSREFLANRPKTFIGENRAIWLDALPEPDSDVYYLTRKASFTATTRAHRFVCVAHGDLPPLSRYVRLQASGQVVNPRVLTDSSIDTSSRANVAEALCRPGMTDRDKALAIWYFLAEKVYWFSSPKEYIPGQTLCRCDPTVILNCYGYCECSNLGPLEAAFWRAAGLKARKVRNGFNGRIYHTLGEVFYDGDWHLLDLTQLAFYLELNDRTIASGKEICDSPELASRMVNAEGVDPTWSPGTSVARKFGRMYPGGTTGLPGTTYKGWRFPPEHTMDITLAPGQVFERTWSNEGFYWNAWHRQSEYTIEDERKARRANFPEYFANGSMSYTLYPRVPSFRTVVRDLDSLTLGEMQVPPCRTSQPGRVGHFVLPVDSAYVITDLTVSGVFHRLSRDDEIAVTYSVDGGKTYLPLVHLDGVGDTVSATASTPILRGMYHLLVKFGFESAGSAPCGLHSAEIRVRLQNNPRSLPSLTLGQNVISYQSDRQEGPCKLTYAFVERHRRPLSIRWPNLRVSGLHAAFFCNLGIETSIPLTLTNTSREPMHLTPKVTFAPSGWSLAFSQASMPLDAGASGTLSLVCRPPPDATEGIVGAEIDLQPNATPAPKRLLLCAVSGSAFLEAEDGETETLVPKADQNASGGRCLSPAPDQTSHGRATYTFSVPRDGDYYLAARIYKLKRYVRLRKPIFRFVLDAKDRRDIAVSRDTEWRVKLDHRVHRWSWRLHKIPIPLAAGPHQLTVTGMDPAARLDCFALVTNNDQTALALMNPLYCPAGFDEALAGGPR